MQMQKLNEQEQQERANRHMMQHLEANKIKEKLLQNGYFYTMSLYGVINNPETHKPEYRRIEIFLNGYPTQQDVGAIKNFFTELIPYQYYTIWVYNKQRQDIYLYEGWL